MRVTRLSRVRAALPRAGERKIALVRGGKLIKAGLLPQYEPVPHSALTAMSDFIANRRYAPKAPNPLTSEEQATLENLLAGMSKSRARVVDAHRRARTSAARLKRLFAASGLWG